MNSTACLKLDASVLALLRRHNLVGPLLRAEVIAEVVAGIEVATEQSQQLLKEFCTRQQCEQQNLAEHLQQMGLTPEDLQWQLELPVRVHAFASRQFGHKAEARFLARKEQLDRVVYSLLRVKDPFLARELYLQVSGGEAHFADLAGRYAEGPERSTKGIVGPVPLTQAHPALAERLRTGTPGVVMEPFQISDWWLLARLERYEPARFDEEMAQQMTQELFQEWVQEETAGKLTRMPLPLGESTPA
jgi:parvulin-like peptidyl-prolyl isomerase